MFLLWEKGKNVQSMNKISLSMAEQDYAKCLLINNSRMRSYMVQENPDMVMIEEDDEFVTFTYRDQSELLYKVSSDEYEICVLWH